MLNQSTPARIPVQYSLPVELIEQVSDFAAARRLPKSHVVQLLIEQGLARAGWRAEGPRAVVPNLPSAQAQA